MSTSFGVFIVLWMIFMVVFMSIGGYFMFRKFLKSMPKQDGKSTLDWQDYYVEKTQHLWTDETKELLDDLVRPVPKAFRDTARHTIAAKIGEIALREKASEMSRDIIIRGYIEATPKRDHRYLVKYLKRKQIDLAPYQSLLKK
ncbi:MAG: DUF2621 domain-containing protein [Novibacillus thermophilus]|jgi:hypothetical protein